MTRYTINIGDEFPLNDERPGANSRRWGFGLRALFVLALAVIVFHHPFHALLLAGLALLVRRSNFFAEARARWRQGAAMRREAWRRHGPSGGGGCGGRWRDRRDEQAEKPDRYKAFV